MDWAMEAVRGYEFNELFLESFFDGIPFTSAFEDTAESSSNTNTTQQNTNSNTSGSNVNDSNKDSKENNNAKGDENKSPEDAKEAAGFIEKIKQVFAKLVDIVMRAIQNFKGKFLYEANKKKEFDKELHDLEKKYQPRFDIVKKNRKYDYQLKEMAKFCNTGLKGIIDAWMNDLNTILANYSKLLSDQMSEEDFNKIVKEIAEKDVHKDPIKFVCTAMGPAYNKIEGFAQLTKAVQCATRGANPGSLDEPGSEEITIDQTMYNNARKCVTEVDALMKVSHQNLDKANTLVKQFQTKIKDVRNTNHVKGVKESLNTMTKISKEISTYTSLCNFGTALLIEVMTNAHMVCKAALVGGNAK